MAGWRCEPRTAETGGSDAPGDVDLFLLRFAQHLDQRERALRERDRPLLRLAVALLVLQIGFFRRSLHLRLLFLAGIAELLQRFGHLLGGDHAPRSLGATDDCEDP